ncbi:MAG: type II secretion system F family protein [Rhizobiales bacterium]|nr:type II secretion system F family protein [Hyphomicrobiales bacterium]
MSDMSWLIADIMIFFGVLMAFLGAAQTFGLSGNTIEHAIRKRLQALTSGADPEAVLRLLRRHQESEGFGRLPVLRHWPALVRQAGVSWKPEHLITLLGLAIVLIAVFFSPLAGWPLAGLAGLILGGVLPLIVLQVWRARRRVELSKQLPNAIDLMVQSLRAGHPINPAFNAIAREMPDPIGSELALAADAISYGDDLATAIDEMARRIGLEDFNYLAVAITIQHSTGGNLATVLESLGQVIRDRFAMERKIKALSAEGRITAIVVSAVPIALAAFLHLSTPNYYAEVAQDPLFAPLLGLGVMLTLANAIALRRQVKFDF